MSLVRDATTYTAPERSRRQMAPEEGYGTNTSKVTAEPLQGYLDNPEYFSVDYCSVRPPPPCPPPARHPRLRFHLRRKLQQSAPRGRWA